MAYPNSFDSFVTKIDKNASGWYVSEDYFNVPASPYTIYIDHIPRDSSSTYIYPSGGGAAWVQDLTGTPSAGQFYVDYDTGLFKFNSANTGTELEARYYCLGDDIMAEHMNSVQTAIENVEGELGLCVKGVYDTLATRLNTFFSSASTFPADQVTCDPPSGPSFSDVQGHIDSVGHANALNINPHGLGWYDVFTSDGDLDMVMSSIWIGTLAASVVAVSGCYVSLNVHGPDADQYVYFYDTTTVNKRWLRWADAAGVFEFSSSVQAQGNITASGNVLPEASGTRSCGTIPVAWGTGVFDAVQCNSLGVLKTFWPDFIKIGANQGAAGAARGELWADSDDDYTVKLGI